jgi:hypothetical protein
MRLTVTVELATLDPITTWKPGNRCRCNGILFIVINSVFTMFAILISMFLFRRRRSPDHNGGKYEETCRWKQSLIGRNENRFRYIHRRNIPGKMVSPVHTDVMKEKMKLQDFPTPS